MILLIDNYDSFVYNLYQYIAEKGPVCQVVRNDKISVQEVRALKPEALIISPGPGKPQGAGISIELIQQLGPEIPILGVCLGHQAIGAAFGAQIIHAPEIKHGKCSDLLHQQKGVFKGLDSPVQVARYHSLIVERSSLPACLQITAETETGIIMGLKHQEYPIEGVQFHPESIATESGKVMIQNFLDQIMEQR